MSTFWYLKYILMLMLQGIVLHCRSSLGFRLERPHSVLFWSGVKCIVQKWQHDSHMIKLTFLFFFKFYWVCILFKCLFQHLYINILYINIWFSFILQSPLFCFTNMTFMSNDICRLYNDQQGAVYCSLWEHLLRPVSCTSFMSHWIQHDVDFVN